MINPARQTQAFAETERFAAVHPANGRFDPLGQNRLARKGKLIIEHDTGRAACEACAHSVQTNATLDPNGNANSIDEALEKNEARLIAYPAPGFISFGND